MTELIILSNAELKKLKKDIITKDEKYTNEIFIKNHEIEMLKKTHEIEMLKLELNFYKNK